MTIEAELHTSLSQSLPVSQNVGESQNLRESNGNEVMDAAQSQTPTTATTPTTTTTASAASTAGSSPVPNPVVGSELAREIDALSLRQALLDFEMANARVLDLTARLVEANARVVRLQLELDSFTESADHAAAEAVAATTAEIEMLHESIRAIDAAKVHAEAAAVADRTELAALRSSRTFRAVRIFGRLVGPLRR